MSSLIKENMTADELDRLPDDGFRYELVDGELRQMPPSGREHGDRTMRLSAPLAVHVYEHDLGIVVAAETGFKIDDYNVRAPDCAFISHERLNAHGKSGSYFTFAPDLAIEVVSPGDTKREVKEKVEWWLEVGARLVWVVEPKRQTVTVYDAANRSATVLGMNDTLEGGAIVSGFALPVREIFK